ncbi:MAG: tRNA lysidine(34) synthetase TilS [Planctomycetes bacterium]|nr:tRNA lysidine(34) synthetase TilS [Planctomycetota bacterium]
MNRHFDEVHAFIRTAEIFERGESILIAFSGGPDSVFLADALRQISQTYRYGWDIKLAHMNHCITPRADENELFCRKLADDYLKLPLIVRKVDIPALKGESGSRGLSIEALGRRERYRFFAEVCKEQGIAKLATGHQLDDQAETVLMRAVGGSWLTGLAGIPVKRPLSRNLTTQVVRPLLRTTREQIEEYLRNEQVKVFDDPSNYDTRYTRNRVRNKLIPMLIKEYNPSAKRHLASLGMQAQELEIELQRMAAGFFEQPEHRAEQTLVRVPLEKLRQQGPLVQRYVLRAALLAAGMSAREVSHRRVESVRDLLSSERRGVVAKLTDTASVRLDDHTVVITMAVAAGAAQQNIAMAEFSILGDGSWLAEINHGPYARITAEMMAMPAGGVHELLAGKSPETEFVDAEKVLFPCYVRGRKDGDHLRPLGMDGDKKLQDIFTDAKVPRELRDGVPLVCDSNGIIWVVGHCIADRLRVNDRTTQVLMFSAIDRGSSDLTGVNPALE